MSYNDKLFQVRRRAADFRRKLAWGGPDGRTWIPEIDETEVDEPDVQAMIAKYFRKNPNDAWKFGKNPETGLDYGAEFGDTSFGGTNLGGLASIGLGMIGSGIQSYNSMEDKSNALSRKYDLFGTTEFNGLTDNNALLSTMANTQRLSGATAKDFRNKTVGQDIMSALSTGVNATIASGGNYWVGLGATVLDAGKSIWERFNAKNKAKESKALAAAENLQFLKNMSLASQDVDARNDWKRMYGYYNDPYLAALGGPLHSNGGDYSGGLTFIDEGGRHEDNPYEGVPSGFDEEGNPNLVEEGEVIWNNDYVFSDRLEVPSELKEKYKLGKGGKKVTFADAINKLTKESRISPNDFITIATTKEIVNEFIAAQEAIREREHLAEREEAEAMQAQDFLSQLDAVQGGTSQGGPINFQLPAQSQEGLPVGFAMGGNKFEDGSWKNYVTEGKDDAGTPIFTTSDGRIFYSEAGARKYVDLNREYLVSRLPDFVAPPTPARVVADRTEPQLPAGITPVYSKGRNGQRGPVHHYETSDGLNMGTNLDKAIRHQNELNGTNTPTQSTAVPVVQKSAVPALPSLVSSSTVPASTVTATGSRSVVQPQSQQAAQPQPAVQQAQRNVTINSKGQEEETLPDGITVVYSKGRNGNRGPVHHYETSDGLNMGTNRDKAINHQNGLNQKNAQASATARTVPSPSFQDINIFGTPNGGFDLFSYTPQDYVSAPATQAATQPQGTSIPTEEQAVEQAAASTSSGTAQPSVKPAGRTSGSAGSSTGRMRTPSGETIDYRRDINGKEWEAAEPYQNFLSYMRGKGKDSPEAKEWMDFIQNEIKNSGSKYVLKGFDDWSHLAEDGKVGPVHKATLKAAEYFAKRSGLQAVDPTGLNPNIEDILGIKPVTAKTASESSAPQSPSSTQTSSDIAAKTQESPFTYRDTSMRYAPVIGSAMATLYGMLNRPDYSNADRVIDAAARLGAPINIPVETIGDYRRRNPFDERYLVAMANQNRAAAARGIANTAGGNRSMDLLGNMSLAHSNQRELGEIMRQAYLANRQDDAQVAEFNRGTNLYNMNAINQRNLSQAQLNTHRQQAGLSGLAQGYGMRQSIKDNWDSATMESLNSTLASLGAIGKENEEYNILTSMAEQGYFPYYYGDRSAIKYNPYTGEKLVKNGGKLNRKKRRF